jgi:hypothetical protein
MELLTWQEAVEHCKSKDGYMLPLGQNIDKLNIQSDADIWTADQLTLNGKCSSNNMLLLFYVVFFRQIFFDSDFAIR